MCVFLHCVWGQLIWSHLVWHGCCIQTCTFMFSSVRSMAFWQWTSALSYWNSCSLSSWNAHLEVRNCFPSPHAAHFCLTLLGLSVHYLAHTHTCMQEWKGQSDGGVGVKRVLLLLVICIGKPWTTCAFLFKVMCDGNWVCWVRADRSLRW